MTAIEELLIHGGTIHTVSHGAAEAVLVRGERIAAIGPLAELRQRSSPSVAAFNLQGRTLIPAFVDAHNHYSHAALGRARSIQCWGAPLGDVTSIDDVLARLRDDPGSGWLRGYGLTDEQLGRVPTREELDAAAPERPVFLLHWSLHEAVVNSAALEIAGIGRETPDPPGGLIVRGSDGVPTGHLIEAAMALVERHAWSDIDADVLIEAAAARLRLGIGAIGDTATSPAAERAYIEAAGRLPIEVGMLFIGRDGILAPPLDRLEGPGAGERAPRVHATHIKLWLDGGRSEGPFSEGRDAAEAASGRRFAAYSDSDLADILVRARRAGLPVAMHAITSPGVEQALRAIEATLRAHPESDPSYRIEHVTSVTDEQIRRMSSLGVWAVIQPQMLQLAGIALRAIADEPAASWWFRYRDMADAGVRLAGSSDYPCFVGLPQYESPLFGMQTAVTRATADGGTHRPDQALTAAEALRAATLGAAGALGFDHRMGSIETGKDASFAVLNADPLASSVDWNTLRVDRLMLRGAWQYGSDDIAP